MQFNIAGIPNVDFGKKKMAQGEEMHKIYIYTRISAKRESDDVPMPNLCKMKNKGSIKYKNHPLHIIGLRGRL